MGDAAGERAMREIVDNWNTMLDALSGFHAGDESAEALADAVTNYVVGLDTFKISTSYETTPAPKSDAMRKELRRAAADSAKRPAHEKRHMPDIDAAFDRAKK